MISIHGEEKKGSTTFCRVIKPSIVIIDKAFKGRLVVPDFDNFKKDVKDIFNRFCIISSANELYFATLGSEDIK